MQHSSHFLSQQWNLPKRTVQINRQQKHNMRVSTTPRHAWLMLFNSFYSTQDLGMKYHIYTQTILLLGLALSTGVSDNNCSLRELFWVVHPYSVLSQGNSKCRCCLFFLFVPSSYYYTIFGNSANT